MKKEEKSIRVSGKAYLFFKQYQFDNKLRSMPDAVDMHCAIKNKPKKEKP